MTSITTLCKKVLNVKDTVITGVEFGETKRGESQVVINARPKKGQENNCPICHKKCRPYDKQRCKPRTWRGLDWGSTMVEVKYDTHRINCPEHGVLVAEVPWAYPGSGFTRDFDLTVGWLAVYLPRSTVSEYMRVDWETVGRCVHRTLNEIEPERRVRLNNLVNIGIDETSYRKGHKYITVVVNHDTNTVVWAAQGHGKRVLEQFYQQLTAEQLSSIKVVTGDGARWITECVNEYTPDCERCVDPFHVVEWAMESLDEVRRESWRKAHAEVSELTKENPRGKGRPKANDKEAQQIAAAKSKAEKIKISSYALGKAPEHLTEKQQEQLRLIAETNDRLFRAYRMKETLRLILKIKDVEIAQRELKRWLWWASHSRIEAFKELYKKIKRHEKHILNTIRLGFSNARIEATNNKIKLIIRKAYGYRNMQNMLDMVYLVCSDLKVPLPNRIGNSISPA